MVNCSRWRRGQAGSHMVERRRLAAGGRRRAVEVRVDAAAAGTAGAAAAAAVAAAAAAAAAAHALLRMHRRRHCRCWPVRLPPRRPAPTPTEHDRTPGGPAPAAAAAAAAGHTAVCTALGQVRSCRAAPDAIEPSIVFCLQLHAAAGPQLGTAERARLASEFLVAPPDGGACVPFGRAGHRHCLELLPDIPTAQALGPKGGAKHPEGRPATSEHTQRPATRWP